MDKYILAHDLGTSSNKACLFNERGQVVAEETVNYTTYYGKNGEAEQAHEDWWNAVVIGTTVSYTHLTLPTTSRV